MPCRTTYDEPPDDWEDEYLHLDDIEYDPEQDDAEAEFTSGDSPDVPCPHCGKTITEDHQRCPHCESFITKEDAPAEKKSPFMAIMLGLTLFAILLFWILR